MGGVEKIYVLHRSEFRDFEFRIQNALIQKNPLK